MIAMADIDEEDEPKSSTPDPLLDAIEKLEKDFKTKTGETNNRFYNAFFGVLKTAGKKVGIVKDPTKNRRVFRKKVEKLNWLTPWPFSVVAVEDN